MNRFTSGNSDPILADIISCTVAGSSTPAVAQQQGWDGVPGYDIDNAIEDTFDLLTRYAKISDELKDFSFQAQYTYKDVSDNEQNAIRYHIFKRTPATLSQGALPHEGTLQVKWMLIDTLDDAQNPGYKVLVYRKEYDNTIDITSWSKNHRDMNRGAIAVEEIIDTYGGLLKQKGLRQLVYMGRGTDQLREIGTYSLYGAPLRYYYRTYRIKLVYEKILEQLVIETVINK